MAVKVPEIPATTSLDRDVERILSPTKETLDIYEGRVGDPTIDRVVKIGELADILTSDAIIQAIIESIGGGLDPNDFLQVDGSNSMLATLSIVTGDDPKIDARDSAGDEVAARFRNTDTGFTSTDGLFLGILSTEVARLWNYEATNLEIATNNTLAIRALSSGETELYYSGAVKAETSATGFDVTGDITATGDISATQIQSIDVDTTAPADGQVLAYNASATQYEPVDQSGGISSGQTTGAIVYRSTTQNTVAGTWTPMSYDSENRDDENYWDIANPTRITIPEDGWYTFQSNFELTSPTSPAVLTRWRLNGTTNIAFENLTLANSGYSRTTPFLHYFSAGDYIEFQIRTNNVETVGAATATTVWENGLTVAKLAVAGNTLAARGIQTIRTSWESNSGFYVDRGIIDIKGEFFALNSRLTITPAGMSANTNYYIYVSKPSSGSILSAVDFSVSSTAPTESLSDAAWMNGNDRCIGFFRTTGAINIHWFEMTGNYYTKGDQYAPYNAVLGTGWTTVTLTQEPVFARQVEMSFRVPTFATNGNVNWRPIGTGASILAVSVNTSGRTPHNTMVIGCDSSLQFEIIGTVAGNTVVLQPKGWVVPNSIYNGPSYQSVETGTAPNGYDNIIINGDFEIWQRGNLSFLTGTYSADRWRSRKDAGTTGQITITREATILPTQAQSGHFSLYSLEIACSTAQASLGVNDYAEIEQRITGTDIRNLFGRTVVASFWVRSNKTGTYCLALRNGTDRSFISEFQIIAADTWEKKTFMIDDFPAQSDGTWVINQGTGLIFNITLAAGTNRQGTGGSWQSSDIFATSNQVNFLDSTSNVFYLSQVQFFVGSVLPNIFQARRIDDEHELCQFYYQKSYNRDDAPGTIGIAGSKGFTHHAALSRSFEGGIRFNKNMRNNPTVTIYSPNTGTSGRVYDNGIAGDRVANAEQIRRGGFRSIQFTAGNPGDNVQCQFHWVAVSEL